MAVCVLVGAAVGESSMFILIDRKKSIAFRSLRSSSSWKSLGLLMLSRPK